MGQNTDNARILVIDDEELGRNLMRDTLSPCGFDVTTLAGPNEALEQVVEIAPDVILTDLMMPEMSGYELVRKLKTCEYTLTIPVVVVSVLEDVDDRVKALEAGADDYLQKPYSKSELLARVRNLVKVKAYNDQLEAQERKLQIELARKSSEARKAWDRLRSISLDTVFRLTRAAEYRDEDTGEHIQRMSHYTSLVAEKMGLALTTVELIRYASTLHDVGKIGIPDSILLKPGKLDPQEWVTMKTHTTIGGRILDGSKADFMKMGRVIALTHHEKWDGSGYPNGLKGSEIPLVGRITAIADVFDALTSRRPYKEPFSLDEALDIIKASRGSHFDPAVVDAFLELWDRIREVRNHFGDPM
ncbi:MAG: response regulator [Chitinivibrionales bacterium]|nr:response regulator [Chitinivibrionales bacterium]